jgi:hypothetical protein
MTKTNKVADFVASDVAARKKTLRTLSDADVRALCHSLATMVGKERAKIVQMRADYDLEHELMMEGCRRVEDAYNQSQGEVEQLQITINLLVQFSEKASEYTDAMMHLIELQNELEKRGVVVV